MPDVVNENINNNNTTSARIRGAPHDLRTTCARRRAPNNGKRTPKRAELTLKATATFPPPPLARHPKMLTNHRGRRRRRNYHRPGYLHSYTKASPAPKEPSLNGEGWTHTTRSPSLREAEYLRMRQLRAMPPLPCLTLPKGYDNPARKSPKGPCSAAAAVFFPREKTQATPPAGNPKVDEGMCNSKE